MLRDKTDICTFCHMQTTLRIDGVTYREAKAEAARLGLTVTRFIEEAIHKHVASSRHESATRQSEIEERNRLMESLLRRTVHFRVGRKPTRKETNERWDLPRHQRPRLRHRTARSGWRTLPEPRLAACSRRVRARGLRRVPAARYSVSGGQVQNRLRSP
jgi:hypothetical protein